MTSNRKATRESGVMSLRDSSGKHATDIASTQKYFTQSEIGALLRVLSNRNDILLFRMGLDLGARVNEILTLDWNHVDFEQRVVYITDEKKGGRVRICTMSAPVWSLLEEYAQSVDKRRQELVFPISHDTANRKIKAWAVAAEIKRRVRWHMLRHTFIVQSRRAGRDWSFIRQQTGDRAATLIETYSELTIEDRQQMTDEKPLLEVRT